VIKCAPFPIIIASVTGFILTGVAAPPESAATGVIGSLITAALFRKLTMKMVWESLGQAAYIASKILIIMPTSKMFYQLLAFGGATGKPAGPVLGIFLRAMLIIFWAPSIATFLPGLL